MQYKKKFINDKIMEAGKAEYLEKGFRSGNISSIAANAGVPVGNLYRYFDGKSGLLDAIVKPAYTEIPKIISKLASVYGPDAGPEHISEVFSRLTRELTNVLNEYGKEIVILVDKCLTTRYDDFYDNLISQVSKLMEARIYPGGNENDMFMAQLIAKALVNSLLDIIRTDAGADELEKTIFRVMKFFFFEADKRK